ncbi:ABC transporter substrate-binding protein [Parvibaculum sedimenti]|uniref:ABC transporter substrate-binding protein n=1 Tax=Parvibaculum sedimenti TaxID=2608632 RepID=A0A6N6VNR0_9HYPH|nr:extracellular solute-binding protein [Parvibaculum sedimenti]KAB7742852.1 ABC transporter substrate-binding protein [Parvibaculum sedimenti]
MTSRFELPRRGVLGLMGASLGLSLLPAPLRAQTAGVNTGRLHGLSIFGNLKYQPGFTQFDYVAPDAPKGGSLSQTPSNGAYNASLLSFDTLNGFILKGNAPPGLDYVFDTLMTRALDEEDAVYGLAAESVEIRDKGNRLIFHMREAARFHDGSKLTAEDAAFSLNLLKAQGHPLIALNLREMKEAKALDAATLSIVFTGNQTRDLAIYIAGGLPIFSKAWYTAHAFEETTLVPPLGSGPYKISEFKAGEFVTYERVPDYWARDLNVNIGQWNFGKLRFDFYRDRTAAFEAFASGQYRFREEFTSKTWATQYDFPAVKDGRVRLETLPDHTPSGAQGWFINTRREKFADPRVREALTLAFDFEWTNRNLFYGLYQRTVSFFENSPMRAEGLPSPDEMKLLEPWRSKLPEAVFGPAYSPPRTDGSGQDRKLLRRAMDLLDQAGWKIIDGIRKNAKGEALTVEFLGDDPILQRIEGPYIKNLKLLGITAQSRLVDSAQFQKRIKSYDFDLVVQRYSLGLTPGIEMRGYWGSEFARTDGSRNLSGIENPAIDALIEKVIAAPTRADQIVAARALDRVLRAGQYWIPQWYKASYALAFWDIFARPDTLPKYDRGVERCWWFDAARAKKLGIEG